VTHISGRVDALIIVFVIRKMGIKFLWIPNVVASKDMHVELVLLSGYDSRLLSARHPAKSSLVFFVETMRKDLKFKETDISVLVDQTQHTKRKKHFDDVPIE